MREGAVREGCREEATLKLDIDDQAGMSTRKTTTRLQLGNREVIFVKTLAAQQRNPVKLAEEECDYRSPADNLHTQKRKRSAVGLCEAPNQEIRDVNLSDGHKDSDPPHSVHLLHSSGFLRFPPPTSLFIMSLQSHILAS